MEVAIIAGVGPGSALSAVAHIRRTFGPITALAHNASGYGRGAILELDPEQVRQSFEANVMGALHLSQTVIPDTLKVGYGFISLTGATAALRGRAGFAPLAIGKSGLRMLGQSWPASSILRGSTLCISLSTARLILRGCGSVSPIGLRRRSFHRAPSPMQ
jgi:NAD(P)-dependent dehydrogenase (short-subunit alcohol dehydrogenase family)